jgi:hypothetical protein
MEVTAKFPTCAQISIIGEYLRGGKSMKKYAQAVRPGLAFVAVALLSLAPAMASARSVGDSEKFSGFLTEAKTEAAQLQKSAEEMNSFVHFNTHWRTEAAKIEEVKQHVNRLGELVTRMNNVEAASPWQRQAIRDVTPMVEELAANVSMAIYHLGESPDRLVFTSFPEYVAANAELASNTAELLSEYVEFSEAKQTVEDISFELELPTT